MTTKAITRTYWIITILFAVFMGVNGVMQLMLHPEASIIMEHLGYPQYILYILGSSTVLGSIALLQTKWPLLKEWAYAGFVFHFIGAFMSRALVHDSIDLIVSPLIFMAVLLVSYKLWKKKESSTSV